MTQIFFFAHFRELILLIIFFPETVWASCSISVWRLWYHHICVFNAATNTIFYTINNLVFFSVICKDFCTFFVVFSIFSRVACTILLSFSMVIFRITFNYFLNDDFHSYDIIISVHAFFYGFRRMIIFFNEILVVSRIEDTLLFSTVLLYFCWHTLSAAQTFFSSILCWEETREETRRRLAVSVVCLRIRVSPQNRILGVLPVAVPLEFWGVLV